MLDFGAGVEQPFGCLIVQNRQAVQPMRRSMDWTLEDNMVDGLICATFTGSGVRRKFSWEGFHSVACGVILFGVRCL